MEVRLKWVEAEQGFGKLSLDYAELFDLRIEADRFYTCCILKANNERNVLNLFEARRHFETCLTMLNSIIEPRENELIKNLNKSYLTYDVIEKYFENLLAILDAELTKMEESIKQSRQELINRFSVTMAVKSFKEKLTDYLNTLVLFPIVSSINLFKEFKSKKGSMPHSDKEIFEYILFREVLKSAKIKGSEQRQKVSRSSGIMGNIHETNVTKQVNPRISKNIESEEPRQFPPEIEEFPELSFEDEDDEELEDGEIENV